MSTQKTKSVRPRRVEIAEKKTVFCLTGKKSDLQSLMADVHHYIGSHPLVLGGRSKRKVHVEHQSTEPTTIFDGIV